MRDILTYEFSFVIWLFGRIVKIVTDRDYGYEVYWWMKGSEIDLSVGLVVMQNTLQVVQRIQVARIAGRLR